MPWFELTILIISLRMTSCKTVPTKTWFTGDSNLRGRIEPHTTLPLYHSTTATTDPGIVRSNDYIPRWLFSLILFIPSFCLFVCVRSDGSRVLRLAWCLQNESYKYDSDAATCRVDEDAWTSNKRQRQRPKYQEMNKIGNDRTEKRWQSCRVNVCLSTFNTIRLTI